MLHLHIFSSCVLFTLSFADVVVIPQDEAIPKPYEGLHPVSNVREMLLLTDAPNGSPMLGRGNLWKQANTTGIVASSHRNITTKDSIFSSEDSFVRGILDAWIHHQHVIIRPDDVWFTILIQLNLYMVQHANDEKIRAHFVDFNDRKKITIEVTKSIEESLRLFPGEIQKRIKTDWLQEWAFPNFTTTVPHKDHMVAGILMMGLMQFYFEFIFNIGCGIPSFTLLGEKSDWQKLEEKIEKLSEFGAEPTSYRNQLRPILKRFVKTFDNPKDLEVRRFWANAVRASHKSYDGSTGPVEGWINGFQFWNKLGIHFPSEEESGDYVLQLDGVSYHRKLATMFPPGYATVPIKVVTPFTHHDMHLFAGMVGKKVRQGPPSGYAEAIADVQFQLPKHIKDNDHSSIQPEAAWFAYTNLPGANYTMPNIAAVEDMSMWFKGNLEYQGSCPARDTAFF